MITLPLIIVFLTLWFLVLLLLKSFMPWKFCVACVTISSSWMALLIWRAVGGAINPIFIAVLMGESVVGLYYVLEKNVPETWHIFRWPFLITATTVAYVASGLQTQLWLAFAFIAAIWIFFGLLYAVRHVALWQKVVQQLIACCRDW